MRLLLALLFTWSALAQSPFQFDEVSPVSLRLSENGETVYVYNHGVMLPDGVPEDRARCCYLHPVNAPGGITLTDDFPVDHYHHRGIFWAWSVVNIGGQRHDLWTIKQIRKRFERWLVRETSRDSALLAFENGWYVGEKQVVREAVRVLTRPARDGARVHEFTLTFEATGGPVELRGDPVDKKGYGGFSVRFASMEDVRITTDAGAEEKDSNMVSHPWAREDGVFAGRRAGLRIDIDPSNPGYPNGWCLRHYGFLGVNHPGNDALTLRSGKPLTMKYKVTVFGEGAE